MIICEGCSQMYNVPMSAMIRHWGEWIDVNCPFCNASNKYFVDEEA